ncbi:hypothetical protein RSAG8_07038, partial [Rhizoctonia solani AG-8 WAC10335]
MYPPALSPQLGSASGSNAERMFSTVPTDTVGYAPASSCKLPTRNNASYKVRIKEYSHISAKEYRATQRKSPIVHLPFAGPYAIDSFRIFSSASNGGDAGTLVEEQIGRVACLVETGPRSLGQDDFDETPGWYSPNYLHARDDDGAEWRKVWPKDKQLRRYLVWRWAIEGVKYEPECNTRRPADWSYLNGLIRR